MQSSGWALLRSAPVMACQPFSYWFPEWGGSFAKCVSTQYARGPSVLWHCHHHHHHHHNNNSSNIAVLFVRQLVMFQISLSSLSLRGNLDVRLLKVTAFLSVALPAITSLRVVWRVWGGFVAQLRLNMHVNMVLGWISDAFRESSRHAIKCLWIKGERQCVLLCTHRHF